MPKITSDGINAQGFTNYPKDWYNARIKAAFVQYTKSGGTMIVIDWKPDEGPIAENNNSSIREWVLVNGKSAEGVEYRTDKFCDRLDALDVARDYVCCDSTASKRHFVIKDGKYYCPHCGKIAKVSLDTNDDGTVSWVGLRARIQVSIEKMQDSDDERNRIGRVVPIGVPTR